MKLLVLTSEPITASQLRDAVSATVDPTDTEVMVVAPALAENPIKFWLSDADDAIERADRVRAETVRELSEAGVAAGGETGESDPIQAVVDALQTFPAERVVVFTHGNGERYREDVDEAELGERVGLPVDRATLTN